MVLGRAAEQGMTVSGVSVALVMVAKHGEDRSSQHGRNYLWRWGNDEIRWGCTHQDFFQRRRDWSGLAGWPGKWPRQLRMTGSLRSPAVADTINAASTAGCCSVRRSLL